MLMKTLNCFGGQEDLTLNCTLFEPMVITVTFLFFFAVPVEGDIISSRSKRVGLITARVSPAESKFQRCATPIDRAWAILFARLVLGLIFFMAGVMKVFQMGPLNHARKYFLPYSDTFLPVWSLWAMGVVIPFVELIAGALVILGLRVREALVALGFVLAVVTFGHLLKEPLYEFHTHVIPRLALLLFVLLLPREDDRFSVDYLLRRLLKADL